MSIHLKQCFINKMFYITCETACKYFGLLAQQIIRISIAVMSKIDVISRNDVHD